MQALRREGFVLTKFPYVCSDHFEVNDFQVRPGAKYNLLKRDAVPSIFDFPEHLKVCCNCSLVRLVAELTMHALFILGNTCFSSLVTPF